MFRNRVVVATALTVISGIICAGACSSGEEDEGAASPCDSCPYDYSNFTTGDAVHFSSDIERIMKRSCVFDACHGGTRPAAKLDWSPKDRDWTDAEREAVLAGIVGVKGVTTQEMDLVAPFLPETSFLMHKMDGCAATLDLTDCDADSTVHACGDSMPAGGSPLGCDERDLFRRWIKQGAKNN